MDVRFRTRQLRRRYESRAEALRAWGPDVGERYLERIHAIRNARAFEELFSFRAFDLHPLRGGRRGQFALRLTGQMRLIVTLADAGRTAVIEEVTDYHG